MKNRLRVCKRLLEKDRLDAFLVSSNANIRYLTGFEGTAGLLLVVRDKAFLLVDSRYSLKAREEAKGVKVITVTNYFETLSNLIKGSGLKMGFEEEHLNCRSFRRLSLILSGIRLYPYARFIERERACKEREEIDIIKKCIAITEKALLSVTYMIRPGISEKEIADRLEKELRKEGARGSSFRTIVAGPVASSFPHSEPGKRPLPSRGFVLVDVGCSYEGYNSDLTRLFLLDKMNSFEKKIFDIVATSQKKSIDAVRGGRCAKDIDIIGREIIEKAGYGKYFGHGLGHGIGLDVHEEPVISKESKTILKEGMVITIEPGIYLPGSFGVRLEDIILVTKNGSVKLTTLPAILKI